MVPLMLLRDAEEPGVINSQIARRGLHQRAGLGLVFSSARLKTLFLGIVPSVRLNILVWAALPGLLPPAPPSVSLALFQYYSCPAEPDPVPNATL